MKKQTVKQLKSALLKAQTDIIKHLRQELKQFDKLPNESELYFVDKKQNSILVESTSLGEGWMVSGLQVTQDWNDWNVLLIDDYHNEDRYPLDYLDDIAKLEVIDILRKKQFVVYNVLTGNNY